MPVAGGTDLWVAVNFGVARPPALLDLSRVGELKLWRADDGRVRLGAGVTFARIERELAEFRPLAEAARSVGSPQIRNRATIGGNLATASPAGDSIPVLAAYGANVVVGSRNGERSEPWHTFFTGPKRTTLAPDELIVGVEWQQRRRSRLVREGRDAQRDGDRHRRALPPARPGGAQRAGSRSARSRRRSCARPRRSRSRRVRSRGTSPTARSPDDAVAEFGRLAAAAAHPIDDVRSSAGYRRHAVEVLARRALLWTLDDWRAAA